MSYLPWQEVKAYIDALFSSTTWLVPACEVAVSPTGNETGNDGWRVLIDGVGAGAFTGHDNEIAIWDDVAGTWSFEVPVAGSAIVDKSNGDLYTYDGTSWTLVTGGGGSVTVEEVTLELPDTVSSGTAINIQTGVYGGGGPATVFGDTITLPGTGAAYKGDGRIQVYLNGQNLYKGSSGGDESANWVSTTQLSFDVKIKKFSIIKVLKFS